MRAYLRGWGRSWMGLFVLTAVAGGGCDGSPRGDDPLALAVTAEAAVDVSVDWTARAGTTTTKLNWGLNAFQGFNPWIAGNPGNATYKANVKAMAPGLLRYHNMGMMGDSSGGAGWVKSPSTAAYAWDREKIAKALEGAYDFPTTIMMNLANWPAFLDDGAGKLRVDAFDAYAAFCADLVRAVNVELGRGIVYWEVMNEKDPEYANDIGALATIYNKAAAAMRAVDPTIKVGGPAFLNPYKADLVRAFVKASADQLDFFSYHSYSTGDASSSNVGLLNNAMGIGWATSGVVAPILETWVDHPVETFHNEWNISWNPPDVRMTNQISAVYDALVMISLANAGATGSAAWNESDGRQGKLNDVWGNYAARPAAYVYELFNRYLEGPVLKTSTSASAAVVPFATRQADSGAIVLVNRDETVTHPVRLAMTGATASGDVVLQAHQVTKDGVTSHQVTLAELTAEAGWALPPYSVTVIPTGSVVLDALPPVPPPPPVVAEISINQTAQAPVIDGAEDPLWSAATKLSVANVLGNQVISAADLSATARVTWDAAALYVLVDVADDLVVSDSTNTWEDDGIEIFIDGDNSKKRNYGRNDFQYAVRWNGGVSEAKQGATAGVTTAQVRTDTGYRIEIAFPWTTLGATPSVGAFVGLDVHINDDDDGGGRDGKLAWFGTSDNAWQSPQAFADAQLAALPGGGLTGEYFGTMYFTNSLLKRIDEKVDFDWHYGSPAPEVPANLFSVRWTGSVVAPTTGTYSFHVHSDDGTRLWVGDTLVVGAWFDRSAQSSSGTIDLVEGSATPIRLEYYERYGHAVASLRWTRPDGTSEVVPTQVLAPAASN